MREKGSGPPRPAWRVWPLGVALLGALGAVCWLASYAVSGGLGQESAQRLLRDFGLTLLISMIAALALDRLVHESLLGDVHRAMEPLQKGSDVLQGAAELGIEGVFARREPGSRERYTARVAEAFKRQLARRHGQIRIACVAAPELFREGTTVGDMLWKGLSDRRNRCVLRVLLLCPRSRWARIRQELEPGHPTRPDMMASAKFLKDLKRSSPRSVDFRCHDFPPLAFLIVTHDAVFVEPYPMMEVNMGEGPIGGKVPMILARKDTETYKRWAGTFEYIWSKLSEDYATHHRRRRFPGGPHRLPPTVASSRGGRLKAPGVGS